MPDSQNIPDEKSVQTETPARKRGRPRKAIQELPAMIGVLTGASHFQIPPSAGGGGHQRRDDHGVSASPLSNETGGDAVADEVGHVWFDCHGRSARPSAPQTPPPVAVGGGQTARDVQVTTASPSTETPKRKPGRSRKAMPEANSITTLPTGAPIAEMPQETVAGGGHRESDPHFRSASPLSNETGGDAVADEVGHVWFDYHGSAARPSAPQTPPAVAVGGGHNRSDAQKADASPSTDTVADLPDAGGGEEVLANEKMVPRRALPDLSLIIEEIQQLQRKRLFCLKSDFRQKNATMAEIRRLLGWHRDNPEADNKKINKRAMNLVSYVEAQYDAEMAEHEFEMLSSDAPEKMRTTLLSRIEKAEKTQDKAGLSVEDTIAAKENQDIVIAAYRGREYWTILIAKTEKSMKDLAKKLPIFTWAEGVRGLGEIGIATIIGETGDLSKYATKERVWKRLGLAVIKGKRQGSPGRGASAQDWIDHGYAKLRRSQSWKINDALIRAQWRGAKEDEDTGEITDGYALGPYGELYARQKIEENRRNDAGEYDHVAEEIVADCKARRTKVNPENLAGRLTKKHLDNKARRIVEKQLIEDMWREWNRLRQES